MLANVFSNNTTPARVEKAEGVPLLGLALSLSLMAAIAARLSSPARHFNNIARPAHKPAGYFKQDAS
jgi:hypothetical protein